MKKVSNVNSMKITASNCSKNQNKQNQFLKNKQSIKSSLNQTQQLFHLIDQQFIDNAKIQKADSSKTHLAQYKLDQRLIQNSEIHVREILQKPGPFAVKAVSKAMVQYFKPQIFQKFFFSHLKQSQSSIKLQIYEEYKMIKQFNKDFQQIVSILESLRRMSLCGSQNIKLKSQSDVITMMNQILINQNFDDLLVSRGLEAISKLQLIQSQIQRKAQSLEEEARFKNQIIKELKTNQKIILDDIELLQSRNAKLAQKLKIQDQKKKLSDSSVEDKPPQEVFEQQRNTEDKNFQEKTQEDYETQYLELMKFYQLYDPVTQEIECSFPKNKTEAMVLLNSIESKIQKLEMEKVVKGLGF